MISPRSATRKNIKSQRGAAAVEFALVAGMFFVVFFGIIEFGRILFLMNTAAEATRLGARVAVVCDMNDSAIVSKMIARAGFLANPDINIIISYRPDDCDENTCETVTVSIDGELQPVVSIVPISNLIPRLSFSTTLPRESLSSTDNPDCSG